MPQITAIDNSGTNYDLSTVPDSDIEKAISGIGQISKVVSNADTFDFKDIPQEQIGDAINKMLGESGRQAISNIQKPNEAIASAYPVPPKEPALTDINQKQPELTASDIQPSTAPASTTNVSTQKSEPNLIDKAVEHIPDIATAAVKGAGQDAVRGAKIGTKILSAPFETAASLTGSEEQGQHKVQEALNQNLGIDDASDFWKLTPEEQKGLKDSGLLGQTLSSAGTRLLELPAYIATGGIIKAGVEKFISKVGIAAVQKALPTISKMYGNDGPKIAQGLSDIAANVGSMAAVPTAETAGEKGFGEAIKELPQNLATGAAMAAGGGVGKLVGKTAPEVTKPILEAAGSAAGMAGTAKLEGGTDEDVISAALLGGVFPLAMKGLMPRSERAAEIYKKTPSPEREEAVKNVIAQEVTTKTPDEIKELRDRIQTQQQEPASPQPNLEEVPRETVQPQPAGKEVPNGEEKGQQETQALLSKEPISSEQPSQEPPKEIPETPASTLTDEQLKQIEELKAKHSEEAKASDKEPDEILVEKNNNAIDFYKNQGYIEDAKYVVENVDQKELSTYLKGKYSDESLTQAVDAVRTGKKDGKPAAEIRAEIVDLLKSGYTDDDAVEHIKGYAKVFGGETPKSGEPLAEPETGDLLEGTVFEDKRTPTQKAVDLEKQLREQPKEDKGTEGLPLFEKEQQASEQTGLFDKGASIEAQERANRPKTQEEKDLAEEQAILKMKRAGAIDLSKPAGRGAEPFSSAAINLKKAINDIKKIVSPRSLGKESGSTAEVLRGNRGEMDRANDILSESLKTTKTLFDKIPKNESLDFIYKLEAGNNQDSPGKQIIADELRKMHDEKRDEIRALGTGKLEDFIENYFPHIWEKPNIAKQIISYFSRRPLYGSKAFLKQRTIESTKEGIEKGLLPVSYNPIDLTMLKIREMNKYLMAVKTIASLSDSGIVKFVKIGSKPPEGYVKLNDAFATIHSKNEKGEYVLRGHYYMQSDGARILNNYLSPGLQGHILYDLYRGAGNSLNQFQLGFSAFHLGFTSVDASVSKCALGLNKLMAGQPLQAFVDFINIPLAPVTNIMLGNKLYKAWYGKNADPDMKRIAELMAAGGGKAKMDQFYATKFSGSIKKALQDGKYLKATLRLPFWCVEQASRPIMEYIVPRQKLGVFADMMEFEIKRHPNASHEEMRKIAQKAWDSVDNRMGQLVYDNLFWNRVTKDLAMASVRSLGWNLGTIRELGGGLIDMTKMAAVMASGKKPEFTYRAAYVIALPMVAGLYGALYQYLRTEKFPEELKDYFFPKTRGTDKNGEPARVSLPSYMKDIYHYGTNPIQTIANKFSPVNNALIEMFSNKDFYGTEIRNADDPLMTQIMDELKFVGTQFEPFGVRNLNRDTRKGVEAKIEPFVGITPAPYDLNMTKTEKEAREMVSAKAPIGSKTKEQAAHAKLKALLVNDYKQSGNEKKIDEAIKQKKITEKDKTDIIKESTMSPLQRYTSHLSHAELTHLLKSASSEEKEEIIANGNYVIDEYLKKYDAAAPNSKERTDIDREVKDSMKSLLQKRKSLVEKLPEGKIKINASKKITALISRYITGKEKILKAESGQEEDSNNE